VTKIRLRTAFATRDGSPAVLLHHLRMLGLHAYTSDGDETSPPPGPRPIEIIVLEIENEGAERLQDLIHALQDTVSDWLRARFYQARADRVRESPKHVVIRGPGDQTLARITVKAEPFPAPPEPAETDARAGARKRVSNRPLSDARSAAGQRLRLALRALQDQQVAVPSAA
jgi:hypothetical protein